MPFVRIHSVGRAGELSLVATPFLQSCWAHLPISYPQQTHALKSLGLILRRSCHNGWIELGIWVIFRINVTNITLTLVPQSRDRNIVVGL